MAEFRMPALGADMERGTLVEWRVRPGDRVARGDIVALVETEKGLIEVEIFVSGVVESMAVEPGATVPVGTVLAMVRADDEAATPAPPGPAIAPVPPAPAPPPAPPAPAMPPAPPAAAAAGGAPPAHPRVSPLARRVAAELGVDIAHVRGTGDGGTITKADVERAAAARGAAPAAAPAATALDRFTAMRRVIATAMARSKREIPHYYLATQVEMQRALAWLAAENAQRPVTARLLPAALLLRAVGLAVREVPELNGFWLDGQFRPGVGVHVGVAISLRQGGLVAPAIHDVDRKDLAQLMPELLDLVKRTRAGVLRSSEVSDATITVTNLGDQGVETVFGVIYPPQVALVGFGRIAERPWAADGGVLVRRPFVTASLSADHRASDGHRGARFLAAVDRLLQRPEAL